MLQSIVKRESMSETHGIKLLCIIESISGVKKEYNIVILSVGIEYEIIKIFY